VYIIDAGRNVAEGTVGELLRHQLTEGDAGHHVRTLLFESEPGLDFTGVLPDGVEVTEARAGSYAATGVLTPADLAAITAWWAARGIMPSSLSLEARSLEDVFLDISGREIR
jgi:ABC-2 type transport system ATP-binding protein